MHSHPPFKVRGYPELQDIRFDLTPSAKMRFQEVLIIDLEEDGLVEVEVICAETPWCENCRRFYHWSSDDSCPLKPKAKVQPNATVPTPSSDEKSEPKDKGKQREESENGSNDKIDRTAKGKGREEREEEPQTKEREKRPLKEGNEKTPKGKGKSKRKESGKEVKKQGGGKEVEEERRMEEGEKMVGDDPPALAAVPIPGVDPGLKEPNAEKELEEENLTKETSQQSGAEMQWEASDSKGGNNKETDNRQSVSEESKSVEDEGKEKKKVLDRELKEYRSEESGEVQQGGMEGVKEGNENQEGAKEGNGNQEKRRDKDSRGAMCRSILEGIELWKKGVSPLTDEILIENRAILEVPEEWGSFSESDKPVGNPFTGSQNYSVAEVDSSQENRDLADTSFKKTEEEKAALYTDLTGGPTCSSKVSVKHQRFPLRKNLNSKKIRANEDHPTKKAMRRMLSDRHDEERQGTEMGRENGFGRPSVLNATGNERQQAKRRTQRRE
ncbi:hypothetical protein CBR_g23027 [Chara braunii]|uniref:Uncharacterized protein n=1 Tax=Chara braunii TaxID=69332 RepID=A0A388L3I5_CHABU|nr:hypothetical protein CBR_g23027 [Chara braunii]|eukprot:GBG76812.1 hypothetical protein CBR_g23027 [Chara braunii]